MNSFKTSEVNKVLVIYEFKQNKNKNTQESGKNK